MSLATAREKEQEERELRVRRRLRDDFEFYAPRCLHIRTKKGPLAPFATNRSQQFLHQRIEDQLARTGRARAIILKGRQIGISTYLGARAYWKVSHKRGYRAFILAHEDRATQNLFDMTGRFHEHCPDEVRPVTGAANAKELLFSVLDSGFKHATAGTKEVGRSATVQFFHGSEVAFWPNAENHLAGVMQAIADEPGTEAHLESTANGIGNVFYQTWKRAEQGDSEFEPVFIPWYWHEDYRRPVPPTGFDPGHEWLEYQEIYKLSLDQLFWAYRKNLDLLGLGGGDAGKISLKFKQEYPGTASEAFETSGENAFIAPHKVLKARRGQVKGHGPIILGVDPARGGGDKTGMIDRQGRRLGAYICERVDYGENTMSIAAAVQRNAQRLLPLGLKKICIDTTGLGGPIYDRLKELLPSKLLEPVNFGEAANDTEKYANRRAEMWDQKRIWYNDPAGVQVPDSDEFQGDETAPEVGPGATHYRSNGQLVIESKDRIKERIGFSPDLGDAAALTFAPDMALIYADRQKKRPRDRVRGGGWGA